jgi:hypothetical protein
MLAVLLICYGAESFVENQHVQNLAKYKKNNLDKVSRLFFCWIVNKKNFTIESLNNTCMGNKIGYLWCVLSHFFKRSINLWRSREDVKIVFSRREIVQDDAANHDILAVFELASSFLNLSIVTNSLDMHYCRNRIIL